MSISREDALKSVGVGWSGLINKIYDALPEWAEVTQVKEKFGGLRFYCFADKKSYDLIDEMEEKSLTICEECGSDGKLVQIRGWYRTLCKEHHEDELNATSS